MRASLRALLGILTLAVGVPGVLVVPHKFGRWLFPRLGWGQHSFTEVGPGFWLVGAIAIVLPYMVYWMVREFAKEESFFGGPSWTERLLKRIEASLPKPKPKPPLLTELRDRSEASGPERAINFLGIPTRRERP